MTNKIYKELAVNTFMKYIFFGTPEFSKIILEKLILANMMPMAVVTNPDRPVGRKKILTASAVKQYAQNPRQGRGSPRAAKSKILQPEKLDHQFIQEIKNLGAELGVLAAYGKIVPQELIDAFPKGIIVVHPSLLPKYRGATPIQSAILAGEQETGTTLIMMDDKVDHGAIVSSLKFKVSSEDNYQTLAKKLAELSADLLIETLPKYYNGEIKSETQNHSEATYTKKLTSEDAYVDPDDLRLACHPAALGEPRLRREAKAEGSGRQQDASQAQHDNLAIVIWQKIKALNPEPGVWTNKNGRRVKILEANLIDDKLVLKKIQFEGEGPKLWFE